MKKIMLTGVMHLLVTAICLAGQPSIIKGTWNRETAENKVVLYKVTHGRLKEIASSVPGKDGSFGFYFTPEYEGCYAIGNGFPMSAADKCYFYFKGGDELSVAVNDSSYALTGKNTKENIVLTQWHDQIQALESVAVYFDRSITTYEDYFPLLEKFNKTVMSKPAATSGNKKFDAFFSNWRQAHLSFVSMQLLMTPRTAHPKKEDLPDFYRKINMKAFTGDGQLLRYPFGTNLLSQLENLGSVVYGEKREDVRTYLEKFLPEIGNDTLKGEIFLSRARGIKLYTDYADLEKKYGKYLLTADQKKRAVEVVKVITKGTVKAGTDAINFTYPDMDGKKVSLTDFKGKVVLVDVWATWCGPCKAEIPALKKLEEEFHDKDVVFLSVSVDEAKDEQKWKDFVQKEGLKGVQLFASGWSDICKYYEIKGIPRFMVFDKNSKIVNTEAPRPSDPSLKTLLETELKK